MFKYPTCNREFKTLFNVNLKDFFSPSFLIKGDKMYVKTKIVGYKGIEYVCWFEAVSVSSDRKTAILNSGVELPIYDIALDYSI